MLVDSHKDGELLVVSILQPRLDAAVAVTFKDEVGQYIESGEDRIVLDCSSVDFIDSSGLGAIVAVMKKVGRQGELALAGLQDSPASIFSLTRMDKVFNIYPTVTDAVSAIRH